MAFRRILFGSCLLLTFATLGVSEELKPIGENDWPWWRGPGQTGIAHGELPPTSWSATENVVWRTPVPGRGHSSPTVVGDQLFVATADEEQRTQSVVCLGRSDGAAQWETVVHKGEFSPKLNKKATHASSTIACDGERLYVNFMNAGAVYTTALDREGKILWQTRIGDYVVHQGYGSSPAIYKSLLLVTADNKLGGTVAGLNRETGKKVWEFSRPKKPNYPSPVVVNMHGQDQLVLTGCDMVVSLNPSTGESLWETEGATTECVTSTVTNGDLIYTSGGYPKNHVSAVRGDGSGKVVWENNVRVYVPSMLFQDGYLYAVADAGIAYCWDAATGETLWRGRLDGEFTASPVLIDGHIFAINEKGKAFVFRADPKALEIVAESQLGDQVYSTPTICGGQIFLRVVENTGGKRQEAIYCIGAK
jgi:outer membrane protein assembly factor BamB